jgi:hypothetical protein
MGFATSIEFAQLHEGPIEMEAASKRGATLLQEPYTPKDLARKIPERLHALKFRPRTYFFSESSTDARVVSHSMRSVQLEP